MLRAAEASDCECVKPVIGSDGIAHTGLPSVRIAFDSAVSIEIACSGLSAEPLRSIQRPSQPVLVFWSLLAANQMSELSKWLRLYCLASTAGMTARSEPAPPVPSPNSVSKPKSASPLSPPPALETMALANASAAPPGPGSGLRADPASAVRRSLARDGSSAARSTYAQ